MIAKDYHRIIRNFLVGNNPKHEKWVIILIEHFIFLRWGNVEDAGASSAVLN